MIVKFNVKNRTLFNYLAYLFPPGKDAIFQVTMRNMFGRLVVALVRRSSDPVPIEQNELTASLRLPKNTLSKNSELSYLYLTAQDTARLNVLLDSIFNLDLNAYYLKGCKKGIKKQRIIEAFVMSRKLCRDDCAETLSKRMYREEIRNFKEVVSALYEKARFYNDRIEGPDEIK